MRKLNLTRIGLLTIPMSVYTGCFPYFFVYMLFLTRTVTGAFLISAVLPILLGILLVNQIKWWIVSLPVQLLIYTGILSVVVGVGGVNGLLEKLCYVLFLLLAQSVGVGSRMVYRKIKSRKKHAE